MQFTIPTLMLALASYAAAITVTAPAMNATVPASAGFTISWTSVNTDPSAVTIELVNNAGVYPPVSVTLASNIETSKGDYIVPAGVVSSAVGSGYQINLISTSAQNTGILAQSNQFQIVAASASVSSSVSSSASSASSSMSKSSVSSASSASSASSSMSKSVSSASSVSSAAAASSASSSSVHASSTSSSVAASASSAASSATSAASSAASAASSSAAIATHTGAAVSNRQSYMGLVAGVAGVVAILA